MFTNRPPLGGQWFASSGMTFGDIALMIFLDFMMAPNEKAFEGIDNKEERSELLKDYPLIKANHGRTRAAKGVADWIRRRPSFNGY